MKKIIDIIKGTSKGSKGEKTSAQERRKFLKTAVLGAAGATVVSTNAYAGESNKWLWEQKDSWNAIKDRPGTFPPSPHNHDYSSPGHEHASSVSWHEHRDYLVGTATSNATANTIMKRNGSSDVWCRYFHGTATSANWADLAEKYEADAKYDEGDVLAIGGDKEVTLYRAGMPLAGVVSLYPAFQMNDSYKTEDWPYVALKGRVPVKIQGSAEKGDFIIANDDGRGVAVKDIESFKQQKQIIGVALESGSDMIEVKI
jgi:hypothetical protein